MNKKDKQYVDSVWMLRKILKYALEGIKVEINKEQERATKVALFGSDAILFMPTHRFNKPKKEANINLYNERVKEMSEFGAIIEQVREKIDMEDFLESFEKTFGTKIK